jgi:PST family polysaccharide transporter
VYAIRLVLPLLIIPILARRIAADDFGVYMYAISTSAWLSIFVEYGFNISATREIASSSDKKSIARTVAGTQTAKLLLVLATLPLLCCAIFLLPVFQEHLFWAVTAWGLGVLTALSPIYYFQGREDLRRVGLIEVGGGALTLLVVYFLILDAADFNKLALIILATRLLSVGLLNYRMYGEMKGYGPLQLNRRAGIEHLKSGFHVFLFQGAVSLYTSFNVVLLGFFCSPVQVGIYASAERLMRAGIGFLGQFSNAIFPRLNALKMKYPEKVKNFRLQVLAVFLLIGVIGMVMTWELAPLIVRYMFPNTAAEVDATLVILAWVIPAIAISNVLGFQYLLADRREKMFNSIIACAAVVNVVMAYYLIAWYQAIGMAISWVAIEWLITIVITIVVFVSSRKDKKRRTESQMRHSVSACSDRS